MRLAAPQPRLRCISATRRCPRRSSQTCLGNTSLRALQLTAEPPAHQQHLSCMSLPAPQLTAAPGLYTSLPAPQLQPHLGFTSLPDPQLTAATRLHVAARPAAQPRLHVAVRFAAHGRISAAPQITSSTSAACRCPPRSSQPHLGYTSLPAPQLTAAPRLHVAARPAAHRRISATRRCPPRSYQPHLGFTAALQLTAASWLHAARPAAHQNATVVAARHAVSFLFSFMFAFLCSGDCGVMAFSAANPAVCHSLCLLLRLAPPLIQQSLSTQLLGLYPPLAAVQLAMRFFSCPPLAACHSLFQLPTPCSSPIAFSAAHPLQLAMRFLSCPPLVARHSLFQLPTPCSPPCALSAAHPLQLAMRFFSCPPLAARHALCQLPTPCSWQFAFSAAHTLQLAIAFSAACPLQLAMRFLSCPPLVACRSLFQLPTPCSSPFAFSAAHHIHLQLKVNSFWHSSSDWCAACCPASRLSLPGHYVVPSWAGPLSPGCSCAASA